MGLLQLSLAPDGPAPVSDAPAPARLGGLNPGLLALAAVALALIAP